MTSRSSSHTLLSPLGPITVWADDEAVIALTIHPAGESVSTGTTPPSHPVLAQATEELNAYFSGALRHFDTPVRARGTKFQEAVWGALGEIPFGATVSYGELGRTAGVGNAPRAVGGAVGSNPVPILIGCHRVMGASGRVTGYSGGNGIATKEILLRHEGITFRG